MDSVRCQKIQKTGKTVNYLRNWVLSLKICCIMNVLIVIQKRSVLYRIVCRHEDNLGDILLIKVINGVSW